MTLESFHYFCALPFDIRREIYLFATPPRVVHIKEDAQEPEEFQEHFRQRVDHRLNPDLAHFVPNWRRQIPGLPKQRTLESCGITNSPTWLQDEPAIAEQILRQNTLYSTAPIPPLLHAWHEPRAVLKRWGYTLAFETPTTEPRTWFHFGRDVLFVDRSSSHWFMSDDKDLLTSCTWRILGQFHSRDLERVRNLALGQCGEQLFLWMRYHSYNLLANAVRLFPDLRELQIPQWEEKDLSYWPNSGKVDPLLRNRKFGVKQAESELCSLPVEEIDALIPLLCHEEGIRGFVPDTGFLGEMLRIYKQASADENNALPFFEYQQQQLSQRLSEYRDKFQDETKPGLSTFTWEIPRVKAVHILPPSMAVRLQDERQLAWEKFLTLKHEFQVTGHGDGQPATGPFSDRAESFCPTSTKNIKNIINANTFPTCTPTAHPQHAPPTSAALTQLTQLSPGGMDTVGWDWADSSK
ncbi:hypothetical protein BDW69DRAFT_191406 [Aspergillus filifer]